MRAKQAVCGWVLAAFVSLAAARPTAAQAGGGGPGEQGVRFGQVTTCSGARGWRQFTPRYSFRPGERLCIYAETLGTVHEGKLDLEVLFVVEDPQGNEMFRNTVRFTRPASVSNWAAWQLFPIPGNADLGDYAVRVEVTDHLTSQSGSASAGFSIARDAPDVPVVRDAPNLSQDQNHSSRSN